MLLAVLGILDTVAAGALIIAFPRAIVFWLGALILIKGISSVIGGAIEGWWFDVLGWIDLVAAVCLLLGWSIPFLWLALLAKGLWSIGMGLIK